MQEFVVDANVLISVLISGKASYKLILSFLDLYTPDFALEEIEKYKPVIFEKTKLNPDELRHFTLHIFNELAVVPNFVISDDALTKQQNSFVILTSKTLATLPWLFNLILFS